MKNRFGKKPQPKVCADDLTRENVQSMRRVEEAALANRSRADRMAAFIARFCGSMPFVWLHVLVFACWISANSWPGLAHWDPYPFTFLTLVVSLEAIFLSSFILISQNYELRISDRRNQLDLQINLLAKQENTKQLHLLRLLCEKLAIDIDDSSEQILEERTCRDDIVSQITAILENTSAGQRPKDRPAQ